ncbi:MAG: cytochrome c [Acidimicrobiia bacterium]|nr:cytochrome c [Acidimicrobiia bacterium]
MSHRTLAAVLVVVALGGACSSPPEVPVGPDGQPDPVLAQGRDIFGSRCSSCHGTSGGGNRGPNIQSEAVTTKYPDIADQTRVIGEGRNQMPAFGNRLTPQEIEAVARYTREVL